MKKYIKIAFLCMALTILHGCASTSEPLSTAENDKDNYATIDPYQRYNRVIFQINTKFDDYIGKPVAKLYNKIMPKPLNRGVTNALNNLASIPTIFNDLLQLRFYQATSDIWRFAINSSLGIGGLFDVATPMGLESNRQNFGLTLARWGWCESTYIVLPILGPSTIRNGVALPVDWLTSSYYTLFFTNSRELFAFSLVGLKLIDERAELLQYQNVFQQISLDPYIFVRNAYLQRQAYLIKMNNKPTKHHYPWGEEKDKQLWILL